MLAMCSEGFHPLGFGGLRSVCNPAVLFFKAIGAK